MADPIVETTDANGEATFTLDDYERDHDTYTATITKDHYTTATKVFEATKDEEFDVVIEKILYNISVTVKDDTSADPIQGAVVTFTDSTDSSIVFESGASGSAGGCTVKAVAGTYVVTAAADGYDDYTAGSNVTVSDDSTLIVEMTAVAEGEGG